MHNGFTRIPNAILDMPWASNPTAVYLYTWLSLHADKCGRMTTSMRLLAKQTKLPLQQLRTAMRKLLATQVVTQVVTQGSTQVATTLTVSFLSSYEAEKPEANTSGNTSANTSSNTPRAYKNDNIIISCLKEDREDKEKESSLRSDSKKSDDPYSFDVFWELYDKKVDKKKTLTAWGRLTAEKRRKIIEYVPGYVSSTPNRRFRKNPLTFLNNESWENEIIQDRNDTRLLDNNVLGKYKDTSW